MLVKCFAGSFSFMLIDCRSEHLALMRFFKIYTKVNVRGAIMPFAFGRIRRRITRLRACFSFMGIVCLEMV